MKKQNKKKIVQKSLLKLASVSEKEKTGEIKKTKIRVIGIGGGGGTIVSELSLRMKKASFLAVNTDIQALKTLNKRVVCFSFGQKLLQGLGTGMNTELAEATFQTENEKIKKFLKNQDICVIIACLGGGIGSGISHLIAKTAKELGNLVYGIFTLPFEFEGRKKMEIARQGLEKLKFQVNAFSLIPNERIFQLVDKNVSLKEAFSSVNKILAENLKGLIETIYQAGLINIDFADLKTIFQGRGRLAYLNSVSSEGGNQIENLIKKAVSNPLYDYDIRGARNILLNIKAGKNLTLLEMTQISKTISSLIGQDVRMIFGLSQISSPDKELMNKIKITLLAVGCNYSKEIKDSSFLKTHLKSQNAQNAQKGQKEKDLEKEKKVEKTRIETQIAKKMILGKKSKKIMIKVIPSLSELKKENKLSGIDQNPEEKTRRNALEIKKEIDAKEKEILEKEAKWDFPAFLRKK